MQTLAEIRTEILRLKWHVAAWRFQRALRRHALALKAGSIRSSRATSLGDGSRRGVKKRKEMAALAMM
jgi:hypothetical protein